MSATRSLTSSKKKKGATQPFYETSGIRTSAKIIEEARQSVRGALPTDRPFTPAESGRILFGSKTSLSRPPSVYSIGARHFSEERLSRPNTGQRLAPIEQTALQDESYKVSSRTKVYPTPPTPVQSFHDLSSASADLLPTTSTHISTTTDPHRPVAIQHRTTSTDSRSTIAYDTTTTDHTLDSASRTSIASTDSSATELKQSQSSPKLSKRTLSAGKRVLSAGSSPSGSRQGSAGERRSSANEARKVKSPEKVDSVSERINRTPRKGSVSDLPVWESEVLPLLKRLDATSYDDTSELCETCDQLWTSLSSHSLLGRTGGLGGTKRRGSVLRTVFRLLDHKNPHLLLKVSRIILAMKVTSKNLLNVCKLLFAIAKSDKNDELFKREQICALLVELLSTADLGSDPEALVYGLGTVKLLASNSGLRGQLGEAGVMKLLTNTLQSCTERGQNGEDKLVRNILVQLTGALRNLSDAVDLRGQFLSNSLLPHLVTVISDHISHVEIIFNISRLFSKLTMQSECQAAVMQCPTLLPLLLQMLTLHSSHADITVRVCFILGNLVAEDPEARELVFSRHSTLSVINSVFDNYLTKLPQQVGPPVGQSGTRTAKNTTHDVLVKLVRLVANLSVHPEVGPAIAQDKDTVDHLYSVLGLVSLNEQEELILNTLATLNNLTYYSGPDSCITQRQTELAELLLKVILVDSTEGLLECTRVYGNLSRHPAVRKIITDNKVDEIMVTLLDSDRREVVYCACGVLVNIMADSQYRESLAQNGGIRKLVEVLHDFGSSDWQLSTLVCKILWNYSEGLSTNSLCFGKEETTQLVQLLQSYSSDSFEPSYPPGIDDSSKKLLSMAWHSEFLPLSNALLNRIQTHSSQLEPLSGEDC